MEFFRGEDVGGMETWSPKPVRADGIRMFLESFTRHPELFDQIEWEDRPAENWPFFRPDRPLWQPVTMPATTTP
jgi:hypothetical protein